jgi:hypothetical protein
MQINIPNAVFGFQEWLNASVPYLLPDLQSREVAQNVLIDFKSERFSKSQSGGTEENVQHLLSSLAVTAKKSILSLIWRQQALRYRFVQTNSARSLASSMVQTHRRGERMSQGNPTGRKGDAPFTRRRVRSDGEGHRPARSPRFGPSTQAGSPW